MRGKALIQSLLFQSYNLSWSLVYIFKEYWECYEECYTDQILNTFDVCINNQPEYAEVLPFRWLPLLSCQFTY